MFFTFNVIPTVRLLDLLDLLIYIDAQDSKTLHKDSKKNATG